MWQRGKKRNKDEDLSESDGHPRKSSKSASSSAVTGDDSDGSEQILVCELSKNRKVSVRNWQGKVVVDIREFYMKDGKEFPGKKGISLTMDQWKILREHVDIIENEVAANE